MKIVELDGGIREVDHVEYYIKYRKDYENFFKKCSDQKLIDSFNGQVGNGGSCYAKMIYIQCLNSELKKRFDVSVMGDSGFSYVKNIYLRNKKIYIKK